MNGAPASHRRTGSLQLAPHGLLSRTRACIDNVVHTNRDLQEALVSAPSRRPEIRRRRTRKEKIVALRRRYAATSSETDRSQLFARVQRLSPSITLEQFTAALQSKAS